MKQSTVLLIALTPFACWGATAEEEALQQQLDQLRQQLIQQNQALHQLQARLEAVKATGATAVAAEGAAAAAPSQPDPARRAPEVGRSTEDLMIEQHNVFDRALTLDFGLSYQHYNRKDLALRGFLALDAIFLGEINLDRVRSDQWTADLVTRYTLNDRWQLELAVPYMYRNTNYQSTGKENSSREFEEQTVSDGGLGDLSLAIYYRVLAEDEDWPDLVWNLRAKAPTGKDPYGIEIMTSESGNLMVPKDLATGNGLWQLSTGFSLVKTMDPAILFANLNYGHSLKQDFDDVSYQPGDQPGSIQLGDWYEYGLGVAFALNERFSLSFNINQRITLESSQGAEGFDMEKVTGSDANAASFGMGSTWAITDKLSMAVNWSAGLTTDAPDYSIGLRFPYRF
ncbi:MULTISPECIES: transporter [Aeromonas]|uniref:Transporter n=1 Tax=Aeromonas media TaxID=651 RepID=A0A6M4YDU1_AERME|nr:MULTISPECIES: transporter [Aeromonas]QIY85568.1 transporter [Aeromonas hydrophila]MBS4699050.1 transporter [Aeromonas media]NEX84282.1 transporter [Aeromonas rivipollensis]QJT22775.1 transporter [Aeromonas media]QYK83146.1 transporter [Aeromonas media]